MRPLGVPIDWVHRRAFRTTAWAGSWAPTAIFLAGSLAAVFLVLWPDYLPMVDAPNHLARLAIIAAPDGSALRRMYSVSWAPIPDLGLDLVFLALKGFCSPQFVLRLCVLFAVVSILASAYVIQRAAFERPSWSLAFVPIVIFGIVWHVGLINYLMGVGVALTGVALFVRARRRLSRSHGILLGAIGLLALVCHVAAFAAFMLLLSALHCAEELRAPGRAAAPALLRKFAQLALVFLPGLLLYALCEKPDHTSGVHYSPVFKLLLPLFAVFGAGNYADIGMLVLTVAVFVLLAVCGGLRVWRPGWPALILLAATILLVPGQIDSAMLIDARLMLVLAVVALSMTEIGAPSRGIGPTVAMAALTALIGYRVATMLVVETGNDRDVTQFRAAAKSVASDAKVLVVADTHTRADCTRSAVDLVQAGLHVDLGTFLTIDRNAFTQLIFAGRGMQPIRARGGFAPISAQASMPVPLNSLQRADAPAAAPRVDVPLAGAPGNRALLDWRRDFDEMLVLHVGCARNPFPGELTPLRYGAFFTFYRIDRPPAS